MRKATVIRSGGRLLPLVLFLCAAMCLPLLIARADVPFQTGVPSMARSLTITAFDAAGNAFPIRVDVPAAYIGKPNAAQLKASLIVTTITMANLGMLPNQGYTKQNPYPFTATQRFVNGQPDTLVTLKGTKRIRFGPDNTGEALDKIGPNQDGVLTVAFGGMGTSSGEDAFGANSIVNAGIDSEYVASVSPTAGEPFSDVLDQLASELNNHNIPATFDATNDLLTLTDFIAGSDNFAFGNTDTGFSDYAIATEVPEPSAAMLMGSFGLALVTVWRWRGRYLRRR